MSTTYISCDADASQPVELHNFITRLVFGREGMPNFCKLNIETQRKETVPMTKQKLSEAARLMTQIHVDTRQEEDVFRSKQKPSVRKAQEHLNHVFISRVCEGSGAPLQKHFLNGVPVIGPADPTGVLDKLTEEQIKARGEKLNADFNQNRTKLRKNPPKFMRDIDLKRLWDEFVNSKDYSPKAELTEETMRRTGATPIYTFGVNQGAIVEEAPDPLWEKLRRILDWRLGNAFSPYYEKVRLYSHACLLAMLSLCLAVIPILGPMAQSTKDAVLDLENMSQKTGRQAEAAIKENPFTPIIGKMDFTGWFHQFGVDAPELNSMAFWDYMMKKYRYFFSDVCQFGNIHSLLNAVKIAGALMFAINTRLGIICVIYIDDSIYFSKLEVAEETRALLALFYSYTGIKMSTHKDESQLVTKALCVLGLCYTRFENKMRISPPDNKVNKIMILIASVRSQCLQKSLTIRELEKLAGNAIYALYHQKCKTALHIVRKLYQWTQERFFFASVKRPTRRARLLVTLDELCELMRTDIQLEVNTLTERLYSYTDAAGGSSGQAQLGGTLLTTSIDNVVEKIPAFTKKVKPQWVQQMCKKAEIITDESIAVYELLAVYIGLKIYGDRLHIGASLLLLCDNVVAVYGLVKGSSNGSTLIQTLVKLILNRLARTVGEVYIAYIKSALNISDIFTRDSKLLKSTIADNFAIFEVTEVNENVMNEVETEVTNMFQQETEKFQQALEEVQQANTNTEPPPKKKSRTSPAQTKEVNDEKATMDKQ